MKIIMYGTDICPDCIEGKSKLAQYKTIEMEYRDITKSTKLLKEFLAIRDNNEIFEPVKKAGGIGIPLFILEDGTKTLEISDFLR